MNSTDRSIADIFIRHSTPLEPINTGETEKIEVIEGIRLLAFDFYGTLFLSGVGDIGIDDGEKSLAVFKEVFEPYALKYDDETPLLAFKYFNEELNNAQENLLRKGYDPPEPRIEKVWLSVMSRLYISGLLKALPTLSDAKRVASEFEALTNPVWPVPGLNNMLSNLKKYPLKMGIVSNSQFYTPFVFEALSGFSLEEAGFTPSLLHWSFEEQEKKPSIHFYETYLEKVARVIPDIQPGEILYVGNDMLKDIYPASVTGMKTVLFAGDKRSLKWRKEDKRCTDTEPDLIVNDLRNIEKCISR